MFASCQQAFLFLYPGDLWEFYKLTVSASGRTSYFFQTMNVVVYILKIPMLCNQF